MLRDGFWPQEALLVVREPLYPGPRAGDDLIVVEGNRRLAAVKLILAAADGEPRSRRWRERVEEADPEVIASLRELPYMVADTRQDIANYLGFRHVTGIKQWKPAEKAEFVAQLVEHEGHTYADIATSIGSKAHIVRRQYIAYRVLRQLEALLDVEDLALVEESFSLLFVALRTSGAQSFLGVDIRAQPPQAQTPVPDERLDALREFSTWLFGSSAQEKLVRESRDITKFGEILGSADAVAYLRRAQRPTFEAAYRSAGAEARDVRDTLDTAADALEDAIAIIHHHAEDELIEPAAVRVAKDSLEVSKHFEAAMAYLREALGDPP